ncbi:hypothetical protein BMETH_2681_0 [methanotrophic bacterial endosymbiont of Bathymodiolus sp.]|nr:hypothetical protein BMETH_2681_0 [methanotrophic bacterial endosymbiont of Bathymodiolus sp.]
MYYANGNGTREHNISTLTSHGSNRNWATNRTKST